MIRRHRSALFALVACAQAGACRIVHFGGAPDPRAVTLRVDSSAYVLRVVGSTYRTDIGFTFTNHTGGTVSKAICGGPTPPTLEMEVSPGRWMMAYSVVELMCDTDPPFRVANDRSYHGTVHVVAAPHGVGGPLGGWIVDTIPGTYRLRWNLRGGADPHKASAAIIDAISPSFRLITP
jgi:hypothetical protein